MGAILVAAPGVAWIGWGIALLVGAGLVGVGVYFYSLLRPYQRVLRAALKEGVEHYSGWKEGKSWWVGIEGDKRREQCEVAENELGAFLLTQALGSRQEAQAQWMVRVLGIEIGQEVTSKWEWHVGWPSSRVSRPLDKFTLDRQEVLYLCGDLLRADRVLATRA
jgi:hypothetical protein